MIRNVLDYQYESATARHCAIHYTHRPPLFHVETILPYVSSKTGLRALGAYAAYMRKPSRNTLSRVTL